jgi:hypothetical protein
MSTKALVKVSVFCLMVAGFCNASCSGEVDKGRLANFEQAVGSLGEAKSRAEGDARQVQYSPFIAKKDIVRIELEYNNAKSLYDSIIGQLNASLADSNKNASPPNFSKAEFALNKFAKDAETTILTASMVTAETAVTGSKSASPWEAIGTTVTEAIATIWKNVHTANEDRRKAMMDLVQQTAWSSWEGLKLPGLPPTDTHEEAPAKKPK